MGRICIVIQIVFFVLISGYTGNAQDYSNKGKDFWVVYTGHIDGTGSRMALYITSDVNANGTLSVNGSSLSFTVTANQVTTLRLTNSSTPNNSLAYNSQSAGIGTNRGVHIVTDTPVVVYAHILNAARSGSTLVLPTNVLGREYYVTSYKSVQVNNSRSQFAVVATEDNTTVEITPTLADAGNTQAPNVPFTVTLNKGDVYQYQSANGTDLTGSFVKSIATPGSPCKPIGVFSGSIWTTMGCTNAGSGDNLYQQQFPLASWGQLYITAPFAFRSYDIFRILVKDPTTVVQVNGVPLSQATLINNRYYEFNTQGNNTARVISSDKPICVLQYMITQNCDNFQSDPEMIILNSIEQTLTDITVLSARNDLTPPNTNITRHFLNVILKTAGLSTLRIDGAPPTALPVAIPTTAYSYVQQEVTTSTLSNPTHRIQSDSGFVAIAYGSGNVESYGYNAGTNVRDLYQFVSIQNQYATVQFPAACKNSPFYFSMVFPYQPTQITWEFFGLFPNVVITNPVYDSTWVVNGRQLYRYKLTNPYTISNPGTYPIRVLALNPTPDGCSGEQQINYQLQVFNPPVADFTFNNVCFPTAVQFMDNSNTGGRPVINRYWDFGDASFSNVNNPSHAYAAPGVYNVRYALITDVGCLSDTTMHPVTVSPLPTATMAGDTTVCLNAPSPSVTFTGGTGTAPFIFTYNINGGTNLTATTVTGNSVSIPVPTNTAGTFTYNLLSVQDNSPAVCSQPQLASVIVTVKALPTAAIAGTTSVCKDATEPLVTFTGTAGTAPYTFTYNINGGTPLTITTTSGNSVTVPVPTTVAGTFSYNLMAVSEGSNNQCNQSQTGSAIITVNPLPFAAISGTTEVCTNVTSPLITFTGSGSTMPYTFTYDINGGSPLTVTSTGNIATVAVPTNTAGTFVYNLLSVADASGTTCSQVQTGSATVVVHPLPAAAFNFTAPLCEQKTVDFTDASVANVGSLVNWAWDFGDPASGSLNTSSLQNPSHTFSAAGTYTVSLVTTNDEGCANPVFTRQVVINPKPLAGFIVPDVCLNDTYAQFTDTSSVTAPDVISQWLWNFGDPGSGANNTSSLQHPQHSYTAVGSYPVELIVTTSAGCKDTVLHNLFVNGSFPVANFNVLNPATLCANDSVAIVETSTVFPGSITKIEIYWDVIGNPTVFDTDNNPYTGKVYRHLYPNFQTPLTRTFRIRYRAYSGGVCVNDKFQDITVNAAPKVQFNSMPDACLDATPFQITQASEIGGVPGSGVFSGPGVNAAGIFNPASVGPGTYTIQYTFTSTAGGCSDSLTNTITVLDSASARFSFTPQPCQGSSVNFNSTISTIPAGAGSIVGWSWNFGDPASGAANTSNLQNPSHLFTGWGTYNVSLVVTTSNGCRSTTRTIPVFINPLPRPNFSFPPSACLPSATIQFTNSSTIPDGSTGLTYLWNFGDPASGPLNTSTNSGPSHIYSATGPFNVNLQVTSAAGCVDDTTIILNTIHAQPLASFTTDKTEGCLGVVIQFTDNSNQMGGTATQWTWNMGDGNTRTGSTFNYTYTAAGNYTVTLNTQNNFGCASTTYSSNIIIHPFPVVNAGPDRLVLEGGQIILEPTVTGTNLNYLWTPNLYFVSANTIVNPTVAGVQDITYTLTVTGVGGCVTSDQVFIKVLKGPEIPNIFSPNNDGIHDTWVINYLESYPGCTVEVFNRYGQRIFRSVGYSTPWDGTVDGKPVPMGTYYYVVDPKNGRKIMSGYVDVVR